MRQLTGLAKAVAGLSSGSLTRVKNVPRIRFNDQVSPHRVFDSINVPLDDVKKIKNSVSGATVNDAAICIVGGALRKYLQAHKEIARTIIGRHGANQRPL